MVYFLKRVFNKIGGDWMNTKFPPILNLLGIKIQERYTRLYSVFEGIGIEAKK
jgi:hypothetical protein